MSKSRLSGCVEAIATARREALLGNYPLALTHFQTSIEQIESFLKDGAFKGPKEPWRMALAKLQRECQVIEDLEQESGSFSKKIQKKKVQQQDVNYVVEKQQRKGSAQDSQQDNSDPDVWPPPAPREERKPLYRRRRERKPKESRSILHDANRKQQEIRGKAAPQSRGPSNGSKLAQRRRDWKMKKQKEEKKGKKKDGKGSDQEDGKGDDGPGPYDPPNIELRPVVKMIESDILSTSTKVKWDDIAGLEEAKRLLKEAIVLPQWLPNFFQGIRSPWRGVLMFGPPGTGKTMLAKAVAEECGTTFFNVSLATITSKWRGESEKFIRVLFQMARHYAPSTIFIDEIDSLCGQRGTGSEHESSRRVKTELLVQMDGINGDEEDPENKKSVLVLGATNHPWDLDDAMRRRLEKRIYIPLPSDAGRRSLFDLFLKGIQYDKESISIDEMVKLSDGYSAADIKSICRDASMMALRRLLHDDQLTKEELSHNQTKYINMPCKAEHFKQAFQKVNSSVGNQLLSRYDKWMKEFGSK